MMSLSKRRIIVKRNGMAKALLFVSLMMLLFSCDQLGFSKKETKPSKTVIVLSDLTPSTKNVRDVYVESFNKVLARVERGDAIVVGKITDSSITESDLPVNQVLEHFVAKDKSGNVVDNPILKKKAQSVSDEELKKKKDEIKETAKELFLGNVPAMKSRKIRQTDIMSSLLVATKIFKNYKHDRNVLVICSDMIEESSRYNFAREKLNDKRIDDIITKEKSGGRFPDLQNVKVYVVAAGAKRGDKFLNAQKFWLKYMNVAGARLADENYGSALVNFNE